MTFILKLIQKEFEVAEKEEEEVPNLLKLKGWRYGTCQNIDFAPVGELVRSMRKNPETGEYTNLRYYSRLSFSYVFKPADVGCTVSFAYSVPYGYTDLIDDLDLVK